MMEDGVPYKEIRVRAAAEGFELQKWDLTTWRQGGHQDWLKEQERLVEMRLIREFAQDIVREHQGKDVQEAGMQIATTQIYDLLSNFNPKSLTEQVTGNPANYSRLVMALAKLSDGGLKYERYRERVEAKKEEMKKELERVKEGGMTNESIAKLEEMLNLM
jgi:hypothetical protein